MPLSRTDSRMKRVRLRFLLIALVVLFMAASARSQEFSQEYTVSDVKVEGATSVDQTLVLSVADIPVGSVLTSTATQDAIKSIYGLGLFEDIVIEGDVSGGEVALTIVVKEYPRLRDIIFEGNDHYDDDDLDDLIPIRAGQVVTPNNLQNSNNAILEKYREDGYFLAEVNARLDRTEDGARADAVFNIDEKDKVKIKTIEFVGNEAFDDGDLRGKMSNKPKSLFRSGNFSRKEYAEDKEKIIEHYNKNGYVDAYIVRDSLILLENRERLHIKIWVSEGQRYRFGESSFTGNELYSDARLGSALKFEEGDVYNREKYEESVGELYTMYQEEGYIHARIFDNIATRDSTVDVTFEVSEGVPARVNLIRIEGNTKTKEKVIRRELFSSPGMKFRRSILVRSVRNVMLLNYFENVEPDFNILENGDVDLILRVKEKPTGQFNVGAGYSEQDKLVGTIGLGIPNFRGNGQTVNLQLEFGGRRNSFSLGFTEPWFLDTPTSFGIDFYTLNREWYDDFTEGRRGTSIRLGRRLKWPDDYFTVYWSYRIEDVRYVEFAADYPTVEQDPASLRRYSEDWLRTSSTSVTVVRDSRDLPQFATRGSVLRLRGEYSGGLIGGDWRYNKYEIQLSKFVPLVWKFVLAGKARYGVVFAPEGDDKVPYSERFSPGGTNPDGFIRGYDDGSVTPRTVTGSYLRGRSMAVYNLELQVPIVEQQIYGLLLADAGNSWLTPADIRPFDPGSMYGSYGIGFRLVVPAVGIIGFDFARGISSVDKGWKPHFQIGTTF